MRTASGATRLRGAALLLTLLLFLAGSLTGCGCRHRAPAAAAGEAESAARITRVRWFEDEKAERVFVRAEVKNYGPKTLKRVWITARLLSASRTTRGINHAWVYGLKPNEARTFSMSVMRHPGPLDSVELSVDPAPPRTS